MTAEGLNPATLATISAEIRGLKDEIIALRQELHQCPELAFEKKRTAELLTRHLRSLGLRVEEGIGVTGVVGILEGARAGPTLRHKGMLKA